MSYSADFLRIPSGKQENESCPTEQLKLKSKIFFTDLHLIILKVAYFYITGKHLVKSFNKCQHALKKEKKYVLELPFV